MSHQRLAFNIRFSSKVLGVVAGVTLCAMTAMLYMALTAEHTRLEYIYSQPLQQAPLHGQFRVGEGNWQPYPPLNMDVLRKFDCKLVEFSGHFPAGIPRGQNVFVYVRHVRGVMTINGTPVFSVGGDGTTPAFTNTPGSLWGSFISPGISPSDKVSIHIQRIAGNAQPYPVEPFLEKIYYGSPWELLKMEVAKVWWAIPLAQVFITVAMLLLLLVLLFAWRREATLALQAAFLAGMYSSAGLWISLGYEVVSLIVPFPTFVIVWETFSLLFAAICIVLYISTLLTGLQRTLAIYIACALCIVLTTVVALQILGCIELFAIQYLLQIIALVAVTACLALAYREQRVAGKQSTQAFKTFIPLCVLGLVDCILNALAFTTAAAFISSGILITAAWQIMLLLNTGYKRLEQASKLKRELLESRVAISLSQIRPHFLYNVLSGIQYLCSENPQKAEKAVTDFIMFLRGNLEALASAAPIPLTQELEHVRHYLALEQLRYGEKLRVEWDLEQVDFQVPSLCVQPLVENAVHWGMREDGLTIRISAHANPQGHCIIVQDDGLGLAPHTEQIPRGNGIGLTSIRTRVRDVYGGSLHIDSAQGKGTTITLMFPSNIVRPA